MSATIGRGRSRIVLACAEGGTNNEIAARLGVNRATVTKWRHRFTADPLEGLGDAPRPGNGSEDRR